MKECSRCGKPFEGADEYRTCDSCREYSQHYHTANRDDILPKMRTYNHRNPRTTTERHEYYVAHREHILTQAQEYRESHREELKEYFRKYNPTRRKYKQMHERNRYAHKKGSNGTFTFKELNELFEQQEGFCYYCGELLYSSFDKDGVHVDHKIPLSRGGQNDITNIALSCARCNLQKGTKTPEEFLKMVNEK